MGLARGAERTCIHPPLRGCPPSAPRTQVMHENRMLREEQYAARRAQDWEETLRRELELHHSMRHEYDAAAAAEERSWAEAEAARRKAKAAQHRAVCKVGGRPHTSLPHTSLLDTSYRCGNEEGMKLVIHRLLRAGLGCARRGWVVRLAAAAAPPRRVLCM